MKERLTALVLALAMVMSSAAFIYADEADPENTEPQQTEEQNVKAEQEIKADAEMKVVVGKTAKIKAKLVKGDGALSFESSDPNVASVSGKGVIKAKAAGPAVITIKAAETEGFKEAEAKVEIKVVPKKVTVTSLVCRRHGKFTIKWAKLKNVDGFEIKFCRSKKFKKSPKVKAVKSGKSTKATVKKLKRKAKYYVKIRTYKTVNETRYYSEWSGVKMIKIK